MSSDCFHVNASFSKRREVEFFQRKRDKNCHRPSPKRSFLYTSHSYLNMNQVMLRTRLFKDTLNMKMDILGESFSNIEMKSYWIISNTITKDKNKNNSTLAFISKLFSFSRLRGSHKDWWCLSQHSLQLNTHFYLLGWEQT